jgi:hypothetical protein
MAIRLWFFMGYPSSLWQAIENCNRDAPFFWWAL